MLPETRRRQQSLRIETQEECKTAPQKTSGQTYFLALDSKNLMRKIDQLDKCAIFTKHQDQVALHGNSDKH